ncbi:hypothetical protein BM590_A0180 [Brucella melitensis M5-90]|nr:hypothetical protein BM590_A0180 [Brucella melitensis M5-90]AEW13916.1 NMD protein affecting ribosome stability and mRNA decay [Brucella canis HSK A52141]AIB16906.1 Hypothetical protein BSSP3_I0170 [Brucella suis bv. 2]
MSRTDKCYAAPPAKAHSCSKLFDATCRSLIFITFNSEGSQNKP